MLPQLSAESRREALQKATEYRQRRAKVKTALKSQEITLQQVLDLVETDEAIAKMRIKALLESLPRVGERRAAQIMEELNISSTRKLRGLGRLQRQGLLEKFS